MYTVLAIIILIASVLLVGVVLIQKSKGGGLASNMSSYNNMIGVKQTTDFVEKATWVLAGIICLLSIATAYTQSPSMVQGAPVEVTPLQQSETQAPAFPTNDGGAKQAAPAKEAAAPAKEAAAPAKEAAAPAPAKEAAPAAKDAAPAAPAK